MKGKFDIMGRPPIDDAVERFVSGAELMTTITVQIPERLKHALKQAALDRKTTVKALVIELIEERLTAIKS
jgi:hypothetical protein